MAVVQLHGVESAKVIYYTVDGKSRAAVEIADWSGKITVYDDPAMCAAIAAAINDVLVQRNIDAIAAAEAAADASCIVIRDMPGAAATLAAE